MRHISNLAARSVGPVQVLGNSYFGLAIGFFYIMARIAAGDVSNSVLNPAIGVCTVEYRTVQYSS